jgi:hypothetical protein
MTVHRDKVLVNKTNRCTEFQFYWYYDSTCFGQPFCPSSAVLSRTSALVHTVEQKSIGLKFFKSLTGSDVRYSCYHNSSRFTYPIFAHSWRFSVFHSLQSITPHIYEPKTTVHLFNLKLKHWLTFRRRNFL